MKDGSNLKLSNYLFKDNEFDVVVFNKKEQGASLLINEPLNQINLNYLLGFNNEIIKDQSTLIKKIDNKIINSLFY